MGRESPRGDTSERQVWFLSMSAEATDTSAWHFVIRIEWMPSLTIIVGQVVDLSAADTTRSMTPNSLG